MRTIAAALLLLGSLFMVQGCGDGEANGSGKKPTIRGTIVTADEYKPGEGRIVVMDVTKEQDTQYDKAAVIIPKDAKIYALADGKKQQAALGDLQSGQSLEVVITGPVRESYPVQVTAVEIVITDSGSATK